MISLLVAVAAFTAIADAQVITWFSSCPEVTTQENFVLLPYMGRWYEISKYPNRWQTGQCGTANYTLESDNTVRVNNTQIMDDGSSNTVMGQVRADPNSDIASHLQVRFSSLSPWGSYWVLDTDYDSYSLVYSCTNLLVAKAEMCFILAREPELQQETRSKLLQILDGYKIDKTKLTETDQDPKKCNREEM